MPVKDVEHALAEARAAALVRAERRRIAGLIAAVVLLLFGPLFGDWKEVTGSGDSRNAIWHYPVLFESLVQIHKGILPLWTPRLMLGYPIWPLEAPLLLHPAALLFAWSSAATVIRMVTIFHSMGVLLGFWYFARARGYSNVLSLFGSVCYAGNAFLVSHLFEGNHDVMFAAVVLPLVAALVAQKTRWARPAIIALLSASGVLSGPWLLLIVAGALGGYSVMNCNRMRLREIACGAVMGIVSASTWSLPFLEFLQRSRSEPPSSVAPGFFPVTGIMGLLLPRPYGGGREIPYWGNGSPSEVMLYAGIGLLLPWIVWPVASVAQRHRIRQSLLVCGVLYVAACCGNLLPISLIRPLREIRALTPARLVLPFTFVVAWLLMFSASLLAANFEMLRLRLRKALLATGALYLMLLLMVSLVSGTGLTWSVIFISNYKTSQIRDAAVRTLVSSEHVDWTQSLPAELLADDTEDGIRIRTREDLLFRLMQQLLLCAAALIALVSINQNSLQRWLPIGLTFFAALDLQLGSSGLRESTSTSRLRPPSIVRGNLPAGETARVAMPENWSTRNTPIVRGHAPAVIAADRTLTDIAAAFDKNPMLTPRAVSRRAPGHDAAYLAQCDIRYFYTPEPTVLPHQKFPLWPVSIDDDGTFTQVQLPAARVRAVSELERLPGREAVFSRTVLQPFAIERTAAVDSAIRYPELELPTQPITQSAVIQHEVNHSLSIQANVSAPALLVVSDTYYPGWKAQVNYAPAPVIKANLWMRAVPVPQGSSFINLSYHPFSFRVGTFLSLVGFAAAAALFGVKVFARRR